VAYFGGEDSEGVSDNSFEFGKEPVKIAKITVRQLAIQQQLVIPQG
jgi:hypothetical protein